MLANSSSLAERDHMPPVSVIGAHPTIEREGYRAFGSIQQISDLVVAIGAARAKFSDIVKGRHVKYRTTKGDIVEYDYAPLSVIDAATKQALADEGVNILHALSRVSETQATMISLVGGKGALLELTFKLYMAEGSSIKDWGGSTTFARRYVTQCVLNVEGDTDADDEGAAADNRPMVPQGNPGRGPSTPRTQEPPKSNARPKPEPAPAQPEPKKAPPVATAAPTPTPAAAQPVAAPVPQTPKAEPPPAVAVQPASDPAQHTEAVEHGSATWRQQCRDYINKAFIAAKFNEAMLKAFFRQVLDIEGPIPKFDDMTTLQVGQVYDAVKAKLVQPPSAGVQL